MPIKPLMNKLQLKMASLQSSRTQCCCCAVGVFAAMFGVFMLSAGICIVVNVGMEVDTSGLPSNLHNDNGRRIVGIILICVAVATMALSASVGFFYFVVCNRKPVHPPAAATTPSAAAAAARGNGRSSGAGDAQQGKHRHHHHHHGASRGANGVLQQRSAGTASPADSRHGRSRDSVRTGSQQSLRAAVAGAIGDTPGGGVNRPPPHAGRPPGSRYHHKRSHHKSRGFRPSVSRYKSGLEPHMEEDVEAAKSVVDLKRTAAAGGSSSTAVVSLTSDPRQAPQSHQAWSENDREAAEQERSLSSVSSMKPPAIVLSDAADGRVHAANTDDSVSMFSSTGNTLETQLLGESGTMALLGDTLDSTSELASQDSSFNEEYQQQPIRTDLSNAQERQAFDEISSSALSSIQQNDQSITEIPESSPLSVHPSSDSTTRLPPLSRQQAGPAAAVHSVSSMSSSSSISLSSSHSSSPNAGAGGVSVRPGDPQTSGAAVIELERYSKDGERQKHPTAKESGEGDADQELAPRHRHRSHKHHRPRGERHREGGQALAVSETQLHTAPTQQATGQDSLPEVTQVKENISVPGQQDNAAFSYDGGDPDPDEAADLRKIQEYMKELMDESGDV